MEIIGRQGQSTIEYLLLIAVIVIVVTAVFRHQRLQAFLGREGEFFQQYARSLGYNYRHGIPHDRNLPGIDQRPQDSYQTEHDTYKRSDRTTRFVIPLGNYPRN